MGSKYLTDLASVCRNAGLPTLEYGGWQSRARGSGGYDSGRPTHVMVHHTASPPSWSGQKDADYCAVGDEDAPLSNLYLDQDGVVWILAAGATNTNGSGHDYWGGGVPDNSMNSYAIGIEANGGYGPAWPQVQQQAYIALVSALCSHYNIPLGHVRGHFEWAPDRKVDPSGPSNWSSNSASWNMDQFRADVGAGPAPEPVIKKRAERAAHQEGDPMFIAHKDGTYWIGNGVGRRVLKDHAEVDFLIQKFAKADCHLRNFQGGQKVTERGQISGADQMNRMGVDVSQ